MESVRTVKGFLIPSGGFLNVEITKRMINKCKSSREKYQERKKKRRRTKLKNGCRSTNKPDFSLLQGHSIFIPINFYKAKYNVNPFSDFLYLPEKFGITVEGSRRLNRTDKKK